MVLSWALTGVFRYTLYAASLIGWKSTPPIWTRYLNFFALYPIGAGSEALVNLATLPISILPFSQWDVFALLRGVLFVAWWPGEPPSFPFALYPCLLSSDTYRRGVVSYSGLFLMYAHMIKQPRKVLVDAKPKTH
jgi:hypothetical protein